MTDEYTPGQEGHPPAPQEDQPETRPEIPAENVPGWGERGVALPERESPPPGQPLPEVPGSSYPQEARPLSPVRRGRSFDEIPDTAPFRPGFHAEDLESDLKYDLRPSVEDWGVIPEPTEPRLRAFQEFELHLSEVANEVTGVNVRDEETNELRIDVLRQLMQRNNSIRNDMRAALVELCAGSPDRKAIYALPPRVFDRFYTYVRQMLGES